MLKLLVSGSYPLVDYVKREIQKNRSAVKGLAIQQVDGKHILNHPHFITSDDVLICGVVMAERLRKLKVRGQIVPLRVQTTDFFNALLEASRQSQNICIVNYYKEFMPEKIETEQMKELTNLNISQYVYTSAEHAHEVLEELAQENRDLVVIGSGLVVNAALDKGLKGVLWYSDETIKLAVDIAFDILKAKVKEQSNQKRQYLIAENFQDGVISLSVTNRIINMNQAASDILQLDDIPDKTSHLISDILIKSEFLAAILDHQISKEVILNYKGKDLLTDIHPIYVDGMMDGLIIIFSDVELLQQKENKVRRRLVKKFEGTRYTFTDIIGQSPQTLKAISKAKKFARSDANVLIFGESGTGKELFAQSIHNASSRGNEPFLAVNCGAIPENLLESELFGYSDGAFTGALKGGKAGLFEAAHNGTIFLDEIGELPLSMQVKLLRVLQEKMVRRVGSAAATPINVRVITATNVNLIESIQEGKFRMDLYYRIAILNLFLPKLDQRHEDIGLLVKQFTFKQYAKFYSMIEKYYEDIIPLLEQHRWMGNVRELENTIERLYAYVEDPDHVTKKEIVDYLKEAINENFYLVNGLEEPVDSFHEAVKDMEISKIEEVLEKTNGNKQEAAKILGISRSTLWRKLNEKTSL